jgi:glucosamine-6-phosphate deaminase
MQVDVFPDYVALCDAVAAAVQSQLRAKPASVLVFPTGNTPLGLFRKLAALSAQVCVDFSKSEIVILDEYAGLARNDPRSLTDWLKRELLSPVGIDADHIHDFQHGPESLEKTISALGGIDLVILGLGPNGHLGFNEPGSSFESRTRKIALAPESIRSNAVYWGSEERVPRQGYTLGLGTIAAARRIILMVSGESKSGILSRTLHMQQEVSNPATILKSLQHATVMADKAAAQAVTSR